MVVAGASLLRVWRLVVVLVAVVHGSADHVHELAPSQWAQELAHQQSLSRELGVPTRTDRSLRARVRAAHRATVLKAREARAERLVTEDLRESGISNKGNPAPPPVPEVPIPKPSNPLPHPHSKPEASKGNPAPPPVPEVPIPKPSNPLPHPHAKPGVLHHRVSTAAAAAAHLQAPQRTEKSRPQTQHLGDLGSDLSHAVAPLNVTNATHNKVTTAGFPVKDPETFLYYHRMVSLSILPTEQFVDPQYLMIDRDHKLVISRIEQDRDRMFSSFKLHRALAYWANEPYAHRPWCFSLTPASDPTKYVVSVRGLFFTLKTVKPGASDVDKQAASFCLVNKKAGQDRGDAISLSTWNDKTTVWSAVDQFMSLSSHPAHAADATIVVSAALFDGECFNGVDKECTCSGGNTGTNCHVVDCVLQKSKGLPQCADHGTCDSKTRQCACKAEYFGQTCQYQRCPANGAKTCNQRGYCNIRTGNCVCDPGWSGESCQIGNCPDKCNGRGVCDTATGQCKCHQLYWGDACEFRKCEYADRTCSNKGTCMTSGPSRGQCQCAGAAFGVTCESLHCPKKNCSGHGVCDHTTGKCACAPSYFGEDCAHKNCPKGCSGNGQCDWLTGKCICNDGWGLADCSERRCPKDCSGRGTCDLSTGQCTCLEHTWGKGCEGDCPGKCSLRGTCNQESGECECSGQFFGKKCEKAKCPADCSGQGLCDLYSGKCRCAPGFTNEDCGTKRCLHDCNGRGTCVGDATKSRCKCLPSFFGSSCNLKKCPRNCANNGVCDFNTGKCKCMKGFQGPSCLEKTCPRNCSGNGECQLGQCKCFKPFTGAACEYANCSVNCGANGVCDHKTGKCKCEGLWTGPKCTEQRCENDCSGHGQCSQGTCVCLPGFYGDDCSKRKCKQACVHGQCDSKTGQCACSSGFFTSDCSKKQCFGPDVFCDDTECRCGVTGNSKCDYKIGKCVCLPGLSRLDYFFSGHCEKRKCPGQCNEKAQECSCSGHGKCNYGTGKCKCLRDFEGNDCGFFSPKSSLGTEMSFGLHSSKPGH